jgi:hypothetical protein
MKKLIFILALMVSIGTLYAQQPGQNNKKYSGIDEKVDKITNKLKADLTLNDNQTNQVKAITLNRVKQVHDAKASTTDPKAFKEARKTIFETWESELKGIVTEDQYSKYLLKKDEKKKAAASKKAAKDEDLEDMFSK